MQELYDWRGHTEKQPSGHEMAIADRHEATAAVITGRNMDHHGSEKGSKALPLLGEL